MSVMQDVALDANGRWIKCGLNTKFIVFHTNFGKYLNFRKFPKIFLSEFVFFKEFFFLTKMFLLTIFFKEFFIAFKTITLYKSDMYRDSLFYLNFTSKTYKFHCFQDHYIPLQISINMECLILAIPNFFQSFCTRKV